MTARPHSVVVVEILGVGDVVSLKGYGKVEAMG